MRNDAWLTTLTPYPDNGSGDCGLLRAPEWLLAHGRDEENAVADETQAQSSDTAWEIECVARVLSGDRASFDRVVDAYTARIFTHVYRITRNREEAEDVVQETFLRAYRKLANFDRLRPFRNWLYAIATNLALNALRSRQRRGQTVALDFETEPNEFDAQTEDARAMLMRGDVAHRLARAIGMLPAQPAALVNLHYMEGMSIREAAETLNMTEDAAKVALHRARKRLRILLGERE
ncbi:MAG TPA: RNA polymerase sigma factor [Candidatus Hydrogenedentes bacterium]|nr:RNA polymerase sigma factor [Candidatus Hydrogenedentota bacterium]